MNSVANSILPVSVEHPENFPVPPPNICCNGVRIPLLQKNGSRSESLHFKPMELFVVVQILMKYIASCDCCGGAGLGNRSAKAESPIKVVDRDVASNSLVAAIAAQKYVDHLPLARQSKRLFKHCGVDLPTALASPSRRPGARR